MPDDAPAPGSAPPGSTVMRDAALRYVRMGLRVFPVWSVVPNPAGGMVCACNQGLKCERPGKHPIGRLALHGLNDATLDPAQVERWWTAAPNANIGCRLGEYTWNGETYNLFVVDVDAYKGGAVSLELLTDKHGPLPDTLSARTGSGGRSAHLWFRAPASVRVASVAGDLGTGIDVKAEGGYVILPPSLHISMHNYSWLDEPEDDDLLGRVAPAPGWLVATVGQARSRPTEREDLQGEWLRPADAAVILDELFAAASARVAKGASRHDTWRWFAQQAYDNACPASSTREYLSPFLDLCREAAPGDGRVRTVRDEELLRALEWAYTRTRRQPYQEVEDRLIEYAEEAEGTTSVPLIGGRPAWSPAPGPGGRPGGAGGGGSAAPEARPLALPLRIADALREPEPPVSYLIEPFLPVGTLMLLASHGGLGKTTLLVQALALAAAGRDFLGFRVPQPVPTLYLIAEGARHVFLARVNVALCHLGLDPLHPEDPAAPPLPFWVTPREFSASIGPAIETYLDATGAQIVALDTVGLFHDGDENSATDFKSKVLKPLRDIMLRYPVSFVLVHHQSKPNETRKGRHTIRGTSALVDDVDAACRLEAPGGITSTHRRLEFDKNRGPLPEPTDLEIDFSFATFRRMDEPPPEAETATQKQRADKRAAADAKKAEEQRLAEEGVALALRRVPEGMTAVGLAELLGRRREWVSDVLAAFHAHGWVEPVELIVKDGRGRTQRPRGWRWTTGGGVAGGGQ